MQTSLGRSKLPQSAKAEAVTVIVSHEQTQSPPTAAGLGMSHVASMPSSAGQSQNHTLTGADMTSARQMPELQAQLTVLRSERAELSSQLNAAQSRIQGMECALHAVEADGMRDAQAAEAKQQDRMAEVITTYSYTEICPLFFAAEYPCFHKAVIVRDA